MQIEGMPKAIVLCLCFLLGGFFDLYSQQTDIIVNAKHYNIKDGLSHLNVYYTFQDSRGFIWVGTQAGLQRVDSQSFQCFLKERNGLAVNEVNQILEDDDGWLWLINYENQLFQSHVRALCFINIYTQEVQSVEQHFGTARPIDLNEIYTIQKGKDEKPVLFQNLSSFFQYESDNSFQAIYLEEIAGFRNQFETWYTYDIFTGSEQEAVDYLYQLFKIGIEINLPIDCSLGKMFFLEEQNGIALFFVFKNGEGFIYQKKENGRLVLLNDQGDTIVLTVKEKANDLLITIEDTGLGIHPEDLPRILIVEDNTDLKYYLQLILKRNYQTTCVSNGKEAIDLLRTSNEFTTPDLIISDIMMPIMDGYQLLEALKNSDQLRHIPTIIITAKSAIEDKLQALQIEVDDYLIRPFIEEELIAGSKIY